MKQAMSKHQWQAVLARRESTAPKEGLARCSKCDTPIIPHTNMPCKCFPDLKREVL